uniref:Large ribosomal subunit protein uL6 n=1 Tax=Fervidicoccus fontis TaxID=683846 RepID=A0A7J3ZMC7_9CREN
MLKKVLEQRKVEIPSGVSVQISGMKVRVEGPKGILERDFSYAKGIGIRVEDSTVVIESYFVDRRRKALVGTIASHIQNMITGVTRGFRYKLKIVFSHFPITVEARGREVIIKNFLGEKAPRRAIIEEGVTVRVEGEDVIVEGIDIEKVGQTAANIEHACKIKELDRRVFLDGIYVYERGVIEE